MPWGTNKNQQKTKQNHFTHFIKTGNGELLNMSFNANDKKVYDLLNDKEYIIPINQRKYIWNRGIFFQSWR